MNFFRKALFVAAATISGTFAMQANALPITLSLGDIYYIGSVDPATPASASNEAGFINQLLSMATGASTSVSGKNYFRVGSSLNVTGFASATATGSAKDDSSPATTLDVTEWTYLFVKYGQGAAVWYVGGIAGEVTFPSNQLIGDNNGGGISHWSLYNPGVTRVPEPMTLGLMGLGLVGLGLARRRRA